MKKLISLFIIFVTLSGVTLGKTVYVNANYGKLPAGYTECEYLEGTGTQYINTGIYPSLKDTGFDIVASSAKLDNRLFGISQTIGGTIYRFRAYCGSVNINMYVGTSSATIPAKTNSPVRFRTSGGVFRIDDNAPVSWIGTNAVFSVPFLLCAEYDGIVRYGSTRVFSAKMYNNEALIRDFVPCLNPSNVPGMYDLVGATFYPNAGAGDFLYSVKALDGTSWSSPYTNLQDAVTYAVAGDLVLVTNGVYSPISTGNKAITIQSVEGSSVTFIDGGGTTRCATLGTGVVLKGFTVFNGYTTGNGGGSSYGTLTGCVISGNTANSDGGGSYNSTLTSCVISGNTANYGGGSHYGTLTDCVISGNTASQRGGGSYQGTLTGCTISGNTAMGFGGGSYQGTLTGCTISGNTAQRGGGFNASILFNSVISNNIAVVNGGGGYNGSINSCIVVGNTAPVGSQIRNQDNNFYAYNSTIIGECSFPNTTRDIFNNIFYGANITFPISAQVGFNTFSGTLTGGTIVGPNLASTDPQFTDPANNDFTLLPASPCINKGANQYVTTVTDLLGSPRIKDWRVDMGAYESQSTRFVTTPNALYPMGTKDVVGSQYVQDGLIQWWDGYVLAGDDPVWPQLVEGQDNHMTLYNRTDMYNAYTPTPGVGWVFATNGTYRTRGVLSTFLTQFFVSNGPPCTIEAVVTPRFGGTLSAAIACNNGHRGINIALLNPTTPVWGYHLRYTPRSAGFQPKDLPHVGGEADNLFTVSSTFNGGMILGGYVNGTSKPLVNYGGLVTSDTTSSTWIGGDNNFTTRGFIGTIHAIRIYNRLLTPEEIQNNSNLDAKRFGTP